MVEIIKRELQITWDDEDSRIERMIQSSQNYLEDIAGIKLEYPSGSINEELLINCCRYKYNNAFEYFEKNFKSELLKLQFRSVVKPNVTV